MATKLGNAVKAYVRVEDDLDDYTWLGGEQSNSVNRTAEAIETSDKSTEWAQYISGKKGATIEITVFADKDDPAQVAALAAMMAGKKVEYAVGEVDEDTAEIVWGDSGEAYITSVSDNNDFGAVATRTLSLQVTGEDEITEEE